MARSSTSFLAMLAAASFATLTACGGGGGGGGSPGGSPPPPPPPPPSSGPTYQPGVYPAASTFKDQCANPRSGTDIEGNAFPDEQGLLVEELFWLRSWTDETYLWNDEVPDLDPYNYTDDGPVSYFGLLKTDETTPSGAPKDDFHFSEPTEDYLAARNSEPEPGYGANFAILRGTPPRDVRVRYTTPDSPAAEIVSGEPKLIRGSKVLTVDGVDVINSNNVDAINAAFFPETPGETHEFEVMDPGASQSRIIQLTAENITRQPVQSTTVLNTPTGQVGYIHFTTFSPFSSETQIIDAIQEVSDAGVSDLVLDLRYNGGGLLAVASQLSYMIAGSARTSGATFEQLEFNDDAGNVNPVTGEVNDPIPFFSQTLGFSTVEGNSLPALNLDTVYILSTGATCSASEAVINGLRGIDVEVVLIGNITCGKPYGFYPTGNCGETYYTIQFRGVNNKGFGDYADGFVPENSSFQFGQQAPGCVVADDYNNQLGDPAEGLLSAALQYRADGSCPALPSTAGGESTPASVDREVTGPALERPRQPLFERNRDMSMPGDYRGRMQ